MIGTDVIPGFHSSTSAERLHQRGILFAPWMGTASGVDAPWPPFRPPRPRSKPVRHSGAFAFAPCAPSRDEQEIP